MLMCNFSQNERDLAIDLAIVHACPVRVGRRRTPLEKWSFLVMRSISSYYLNRNLVIVISQALERFLLGVVRLRLGYVVPGLLLARAEYRVHNYLDDVQTDCHEEDDAPC